MAQILPATLPRDTPKSERIVHEAARRLPDEWQVYHGRRIVITAGPNRQPFEGEVDFFFLHPSWGLMVMEVKGGSAITLREGTWRSTSHDDGKENKIKDPGKQASRVAHKVGEALNADPLFGRNDWRVSFSWCVCFPGMTLPQGAKLPPGLPDERVLLSGDLENLEQSLIRAFKSDQRRPVEELSRQLMKAIHARLLPSLDLVESLPSAIDRQNRVFLRLTEEQGQILRSLEGIPRLRIAGAAGTGKTLLAVEKARRLAEEGARVLLLVFNEPLAKSLRKGRGRYAVHHFHGLVADYVKAAGMTPLKPPDEPEAQSRFWDDEAPELLLEALERVDGARYDAVVIDEGQDFLGNWWEVIEELLTEPHTGTLYVFLDDRQNLYGGTPPEHLALHPIALTRNCRNTRRIAEYAGQCIDAELEVWSEAPEGSEVVVRDCKTPDEEQAAIERLLTRLVCEQQLRTEQVVVLSARSRSRSCLAGVDRLGDFALVGLDQTPGKREVRFDSLYRFKGLEADCVILCDVPRGRSSRPALPLYVGASRARHELYVIRISQ
jgi:hypothetical protein